MKSKVHPSMIMAALAATASTQSARVTETLQTTKGGFGFTPEWLAPRAITALLARPRYNQRKKRKARRQAYAAGNHRSFTR